MWSYGKITALGVRIFENVLILVSADSVDALGQVTSILDLCCISVILELKALGKDGVVLSYSVVHNQGGFWRGQFAFLALCCPLLKPPATCRY